MILPDFNKYMIFNNIFLYFLKYFQNLWDITSIIMIIFEKQPVSNELDPAR